MIRSVSGIAGGVCCVAVAFGVVLVVCLVASPGLAAPQPAAVVRYVAPGADCGGYTPCYASIQAALDAGGPNNDEIRVAQGTYTGVSQRSGVTQAVYLNKTATIRGGYDTSNWDVSSPATQPSIIDAGWQGRVFYLTGDISPTIDGLRLQRGAATGLRGGYRYEDAGGGIYVKDARGTLQTNVIMNNVATVITNSITNSGGGVYLYGSSLTLRGNTIYSNSAQYGGGLASKGGQPLLEANGILSNTASSGGGIYLEQSAAQIRGNWIISNTASYGGGLSAVTAEATVVSNTFQANTAGFGAGMSASGALTITSNVFTGNDAGYGFGGALQLSNDHGSKWLTVRGNTIVANRAAFGGAMVLAEYPILVTANVMSGNAAHEGGAVWSGRTDAQFANNAIIDNTATRRAAGIAINAGTVSFTHNTVARNQSPDGAGFTFGGTFSGVTATMTNTIIVQQGIGITVATGSKVQVNGVLWSDNVANTAGAGSKTISNAYTGEPNFKNDGYHITRGSAAIDRAVPAGTPNDIDNEPRPSGAAADLGADEFVPWTATRFVFLPIIVR